MNPDAKIYVAGHNGMVGAALVRQLGRLGYRNLLLASRRELDLVEKAPTLHFFEREQPTYVFLAAARVGGIRANSAYPVEFYTENLSIQTNVLSAAHHTGVEKLMFLGSSCIYPRLAPQPLREEYLLTGPLEPTNEAYALAKIVGLKLCDAYRKQYGRDFVSVLPCNLYGPGDNFDPNDSHVVPGLLRRFHFANEAAQESVQLWGTGAPRRELMHVDDLASACVFLMEHWSDAGGINVGTGTDCTIRELGETISSIVGYRGRLEFDATHPDGMPRKVLDVSRLAALGWKPTISLKDGLRSTYTWFLNHLDQVRGLDRA